MCGGNLMALVYCTECGKQIADSAASCPQCGAANRALVSANPTADPPSLFATISNIGQTRRRTSSDKSRTTAAWLCLLLGGLSAHRFYVGKPVTAILQVITAGGLLVWLVVDLVRILNGTFEDSEGLQLVPNHSGRGRTGGSSVRARPEPPAKKNRWVAALGAIALVLVVGGLIGQSGLVGVGSNGSRSDDPIASVGQTLRLGNLEVIVTKVQARSVIASMPMGTEPLASAATGTTYVIVEYQYKNGSNAPMAWADPDLVLLNQDNVRLATDLQARAALEFEGSYTAKLFSDLNPGVVVTDAKVFHVNAASYDPDTWTIEVSTSAGRALVAIAPRPNIKPDVAPLIPQHDDSPPFPRAPGALAADPDSGSSTGELQTLRNTRIGRFARHGQISAALMEVVNIDSRMQGRDFSSGGCGSYACSGLGIIVFAYSKTGASPEEGSVMLIAPDGQRISSSGGMDEADAEEFGWNSNQVLRSDNVFRVEGQSPTDILKSGRWQVEATIGGERFVFPVIGAGNANAHEGNSICCAALIDVAVDDVLNVRSAPDAGSDLVVSVSPNQQGRLAVLDCFGEESRFGWQSLEQSQAEGTWCLVEVTVASPGSDWAQTYGWANARHLRFEAGPR